MITAHMKKRTQLVNKTTTREFIAFLLVGVINTIFGYSIFAACIYLGIAYTLATLISTVLGIGFNFITVGNFVFSNTNKKLILQFVCVYGLQYLIGIGIIGSINHFINNLYLAGAINTLLMPPLTFYLNKRFVFHRPTPTVASS